MLPNDWDAVLGDALHTPGWSELTEFVDQERKAGLVYPAAEKVFRAFELTPYAKVRVVILGQDPYHGEGQAHGLAFSVGQGKPPPSLRKIRKELERDPEVAPPEGGNLEGWARQGVLLLNTVLTVRAGAPNSHRARGWEDFTDAVISAVNEKSDRVVFLLWGAAAQKKAGRSPTRLTGSSLPRTRQLARVLTTPSLRRDRSPVRTRPWSKQVERGSSGIDRPAHPDPLTGR